MIRAGQGGTSPPPASMTRRDRWVLLLAVLPFLALVLWQWPGGHGVALGDYAQYVLHARALAEGRGYTDTAYIHTDLEPYLGPRAYPPGLPFLLAGLFMAVGENTFVIRVLMALIAPLFLILAGRYFWQPGRLVPAFLVVLTAGLSAEMLLFVSRINTDLPFCALLWGAIYIADRRRWTAFDVSILVLLTIGAVAFRSAGLALVPGFVLFCILRYREVGLRPLAPALAGVATYLTVEHLLPVASSYLEQMSTAPGALALQFGYNAWSYRLALFECLLYPFSWNWLNDVYHAVATPLVAFGLLQMAREWRRFTLLIFFGLGYLAILAVFSATPPRYVWPLYPVIIYSALSGGGLVFRWIADRWPLVERRRRGVLWVMATLLLVPAMVRATDRQLQDDPVLARAVEDLTRYFEAAKESRPVRVLYFRPRVLAMRAGVPAMALFQASPARTLTELRERGITDVVVGDVDRKRYQTESVRRTIATHPDLFTLERRNEVFEIYRFQGTSTPSMSAIRSEVDGPPSP